MRSRPHLQARKNKALIEAEAQGLQVLNGLGMLLFQAGEQFRLWTGAEAPIGRDGRCRWGHVELLAIPSTRKEFARLTRILLVANRLNISSCLTP